MTPAQLFATAYRLEVDETGASERAVAEWVRGATAREVIAVAAVARSAFRYGLWKEYVPLLRPLPETRFEAIARSARSEVAALLTLHRSGWVRELALPHAARAPEGFVVPFLLLRTEDIVPAIGAAAAEAIATRLHPEHAPAFARSLGILALLRGRVRGARVPVADRVEGLLRDQRCRTALVAACDDDDAAVRQAALQLRLSVEPAEHVLRRALADRDTRIRLWAARTATSRATSDADRRALLPDVEASGSPWARVLALRARDRLGAADATLEPALLDPRAVVRYEARALLRARRPNRAFGATRAVALAKLGDPRARGRDLLGALGALADVGLPEDAPVVARFADDPRAGIRAEARRALELLAR